MYLLYVFDALFDCSDVRSANSALLIVLMSD